MTILLHLVALWLLSTAIFAQDDFFAQFRQLLPSRHVRHLALGDVDADECAQAALDCLGDTSLGVQAACQICLLRQMSLYTDVEEFPGCEATADLACAALAECAAACSQCHDDIVDGLSCLLMQEAPCPEGLQCEAE